jgi:hypothetical protein
MSLGQKPQGPLRTWEPKGVNGIVGVHTLNVIGSGIFGNRTVPPTGLPTGVGSFGVPGVSATFSATGVFQIRFPPVQAVDIRADVSSISGYMYNAQVQNQSGPSGSAELHIQRLGPPGTVSTGLPDSRLIQASGFLGFIPTGSKVMLTFTASPNFNPVAGTSAGTPY